MNIILGVSGIILLIAFALYLIHDMVRFQLWVDLRLQEIRYETEKLRCDVIELRRQIRVDSKAEEKEKNDYGRRIS